MADGYRGSKYLLGNVAITRAITAAVRWRIESRKAINRVRTRLNPKGEKRSNDATTAQEFAAWVARGFTKLNIGGGKKALKGFINIDFIDRGGGAPVVLANITDLSFIGSGSVDHVHSNHVIEHLSRTEVEQQLFEWNRILRAGGCLTIRCPNALGVCYSFWCETILEQEREEFVALGFPEDEDFGNPADRWVSKDFYAMLHWLYGDMGTVDNEHRSLHTPSSLRALVEAAGFDVLKMAEPEAVNLVVVARKKPQFAELKE